MSIQENKPNCLKGVFTIGNRLDLSLESLSLFNPCYATTVNKANINIISEQLYTGLFLIYTKTMTTIAMPSIIHILSIIIV